MSDGLMTRVLAARTGYHDGFYGAQGLEPLFPDASPDYTAGWNAYWDCRALLTTTATEAKEPPLP